MKQWWLLPIAGVLLVCSRRKIVLNQQPEQNDGMASEPLQVTMKAEDYKEGILSIKVTHPSGYDAAADEQQFRLEKDSSEGWKTLKGHVEILFPSKNILLNDRECTILRCSLQPYGSLTSGRYRLWVRDRYVYFELKYTWR